MGDDVDYFILFLEGIITFISPCILPMLPIYISYFAGQNGEGTKKKALINSMGFVLGFTIIFVLLGAFTGTIGVFLREYKTIINIVTGLIVIFFGLNFMNIISIPIFNINRNINIKTTNMGFLSSLLFGIVFSIAWTPCVGAFLGSALMFTASVGGSFKGMLMLFSFSMGLGIPFIISAVLIDGLKSTFDFIKRNYQVISFISGGFLVIIGILMATGYLSYFLSLLSF